jgi:lysophospholipase L1-like esterase
MLLLFPFTARRGTALAALFILTCAVCAATSPVRASGTAETPAAAPDGTTTPPAAATPATATPTDDRASIKPTTLPVIDQEATPLPMAAAMTDRNVRYTGRFDAGDPAAPRCCWPNSTVSLAFEAAAVNVKIDETGDSDRYEVVVDGTPSLVLSPHAGVHVYRIFEAHAAQSHVVEIVKRSESFFGIGKFIGFELSLGGKVKKLPKRPKHKLEIVGDSISVGYGNEAGDRSDRFTPDNTNAYMAYGAIAARALGAEYTCIAWSGRKMWPEDSMPAIYDRTIALEDKSVWDHAKWVPDAVLINLSTNDFGGKYPDFDRWTQAYEAFITRLRSYYPKAAIYCAISPMMDGSGRDATMRYITKVVEDERAAGDKNVRLIEFAVQNPRDGFGADWHPNVKTNQIMAAKLEEALRNDLHWDRK